MSVTTSVLTATFYDSIGAPLPGVVLSATLYGIDLQGKQYVSGDAVTSTSDATGVATLTLFANASGTRYSYYRITATSPTGESISDSNVSIPSSDCNLADVEGNWSGEIFTGGVNATISGNLTVNGNTTLSNTTATLSGGTINGVVIGGTTPAAGTFTSVSASTATLTSADINGGTIDGAVIGGTTPAAGTFTSLSDSGNLAFTGTGNRITGDFSNGTQANRVMFQTSTANGSTYVSAIPNGTGTISGLNLESDPTVTNSSITQLSVSSTESALNATKRGSGTYLPMTFYTGGSERMRIDTSGQSLMTQAPSSTAWGASWDGTYTLKIKNADTTTNAYSGLSFLVGTNSEAAIGAVRTSDGECAIGFATRSGGVRAERMRIDSSGNVGVGATSLSSWGTASNPSITIKGTNASYPSRSGALKLVSQDGVTTVAVASDSGSGDLQFYTGGSERMRIDTSGTVGIGTQTASGTRLEVKGVDATSSNYALITRDSSNNPLFLVRNDGLVAAAGATGGLGYASGTGAGGTVTQLTSKSTGVTLNKPTGQITTTADALGAGASVTFRLSNSLIGAYDVILVIVYGYTAYNVDAFHQGAGLCDIRLTNTTGGSLSQAVPINFVIVKGAWN